MKNRLPRIFQENPNLDDKSLVTQKQAYTYKKTQRLTSVTRIARYRTEFMEFM